jgi:glycerophosphoryl diester phosphodiesterase
MDASLRQRARDAGWLAMVYTVNEPDDARRLQALGIDGIITDAVDRFAPSLA